MKRFICILFSIMVFLPGLRGQDYKSYIDIRYGAKRTELKADDPDQDRLLDIYLPATAKPETGYPVLVFIHGGGFTSGSKDMRPSVQAIFEKLLDHGYAVVSINYILGRRRPAGEADEAARTQGRQQQRQGEARTRRTGAPDDPVLAPGAGSPLLMAGEDAVMALQWIDAHASEYGLDTGFLALMGGSAGSATSICAAQYLHPETPRVAAIVNCWGGFNALDAILDGTIPMLSFHGTEDSTIPIDQAFALQRRMEELGSKDSRLVVMEGKGHAQYKYIGEERMGEVISFLDGIRKAETFSDGTAAVSTRKVGSLNEGWQFKKGSLQPRGVFPNIFIPRPDTTVNLPHTWNQADFMSDEGYYRGEGSYVKELYIPATWKGKRVFINFEGVGSAAWVDVNGTAVASHKGAYNAFTVDLTDHLAYGQKNLIIVSCSNRVSNEIAPTGGDFNMYGGIYRDASTGNHSLTACYQQLSDEESNRDGIHPIMINEVSGSNSIYVNEYGKKNDWVELYNPTNSSIDIEGMFLTDDLSNPTKYQITKGNTNATTVIPSHNYLIIWCDKLSTTDRGLHSTFKIDGEGGVISLTSNDKSWADTLYYRAHDGNSTVGRYPDASNDVFIFNIPTIAKPNQISSYVIEQKNVLMGDVNGDGLVNISDVVCLINYILEKDNSVFIINAADLNSDEIINISDAVYLVNTILAK